MSAPPDRPARRPFPEREAKREPRRVRGGLRLRGKDGPVVNNYIAQRLLDLIERHWSDTTLAEGLFYARRGQIRTLSIQAGGIVSASVQGFPAKPYAVTLQLPPLSEGQWEAIVADMARSALVSARMLSGEPPAETSLREIFTRHGAALLPVADEIVLDCQCVAARKEPCTHGAAVALHLVEHLSRSPLVVFGLRGLDDVELTDRLRHARAIQRDGVATTASDPLIAQTQTPSPPLETVLDEFYRLGAAVDDDMPCDYQPHALLRRLAPSPLPGRFPIVGLLASVYDTVAEKTRSVDDESP